MDQIQTEMFFMIPAKLVLQTGEVFKGEVPNWVKGINCGEIVFNTGMVGYTQVLTDPSYMGQIVCFTYPMIGNYGVESQEYWESNQIHAAGVVVSELAPFYSRAQSKYSLQDCCQEYKRPIIAGVDTRQLTKTLRYRGVVAGAIVVGGEMPQKYLDISDLELVPQVTTKETQIYGNGEKKVIVVDCGMKASIWRYLCKYHNLTLKRVPYDYDYVGESYDGVFISNGPGDPARCQKTAKVLKDAMSLNSQKPIFGICLGSQIMGIAVGVQTYKLKFGHRAQNHPCFLEGSNRSYLTSQNHGFAIDESTMPKKWEVWFRNLNDYTIQGIKHKTLPYSSVQFHPEACPGPVDTAWLFDSFVDQL